MLDFNLNNGFSSSTLYNSLDIDFTPMTVRPGDQVEIWVNFTDGIVKQHLEVRDARSRTIESAVGGSGTATVDIEGKLSGVTGELSVFPFMPIKDDVTFGQKSDLFSGRILLFSDDLSNGLFYFHDIHFIVKNTSADDTISLNRVEFTVSGNAVQIGEWPLPEPATIALFGAGLAGLGLAARRKRLVN